jgi:hypothetical protein
MGSDMPTTTIHQLRRNFLRALVLMEVASTLIGAVLCVAAPERVIGPLVAGPLDAQAADVLPHAGASWVVLAMLLLGSLRLRAGQEGVLRMLLIPLLVGDVLHLGAIAILVGGHGDWTAGAVGLALTPVVVATYRLVLLFRPGWFLPTS